MFPERRQPAHEPIKQAGNRATVVFVTVCTKNKRPILADPAIHRLLIEAWKEAWIWEVGRYVVMPDHVHLFASPTTFPPEPIRRWTKFWKSLVARHWPEPHNSSIWQADVWDTQLRRGESYSAKWDYIQNNPVRAGLAAKPTDWPFQGELNNLYWHDA